MSPAARRSRLVSSGHPSSKAANERVDYESCSEAKSPVISASGELFTEAQNWPDGENTDQSRLAFNVGLEVIESTEMTQLSFNSDAKLF